MYRCAENRVELKSLQTVISPVGGKRQKDNGIVSPARKQDTILDISGYHAVRLIMFLPKYWAHWLCGGQCVELIDAFILVLQYLAPRATDEAILQSVSYG